MGVGKKNTETAHCTINASSASATLAGCTKPLSVAPIDGKVTESVGADIEAILVDTV